MLLLTAPALATMGLLLLASAFFSGSETALFALSQQEKLALRRQGGVGAEATIALLASPRRLLITLLLGNMLANVTYFVLASAMALQASSAVEATLWSSAPLLAIVLLGEVLPKLVAASQRQAWCRAMSPTLLLIHRVSAPVRVVIDTLVITPLARLIAPQEAPALSRDELETALAGAVDSGVIDAAEAAVLSRLASLNETRVAAVMTPRVRMAWLSAEARTEEARVLAARRRVARAVLFETTPDSRPLGVVDLRTAVAAAPGEPVLRHAAPPVFVPEQASLHAMIQTLVKAGESLAIVVDEFGAVEGVASLEDAASRILDAMGQGAASEAEAHAACAQREGAP
ncbi:MAG: DUF21 domain-containing protein [Planctomycetota bacterium]|nr:MAG: DUF21 domain-containing protein [Planctomycetota bacterium]